MSRLTVNLKNLNQRRVSILVSQLANGQALREFFTAQGFTVEVTGDAAELYTRLCADTFRPGFVLISTQVQGAMARMMPDFVVRRFHVPVLLFTENPDLPVVTGQSQEVLPPEILAVGHMEPERLLESLENFEEGYLLRVEGRKSSSSSESNLAFLRSSAKKSESSVPSHSVPSHSEPGSETSEDGMERTSKIPEDVLRSLKAALNSQEVVVKDDDVLTLHACKVADAGGGQGYFVFAFPVRDADHQLDQALLILESRVREAAGPDAAIEHLIQAVPGPFFREVMLGSDEVVTGSVGNQEMILAYFQNRSDIEETHAVIADQYFLVPVEEWWTRLPLPCHAYVWLEKNNKRVLYVRPGDRLRPEGLSRLRNKGVNHLAVEPTDFSHYRKIREMVHFSRAGDQFRLTA